MYGIEGYDFVKFLGFCKEYDLLKEGGTISKKEAEEMALCCSYILDDIYDEWASDSAPNPEEAKILREMIILSVKSCRMSPNALELLTGDSEEIDQAVYRNPGINRETKKQLEEKFRLYIQFRIRFPNTN